MKKTKLLTSLFMAMFMMAVCPQSVLADDDAFAVTINGETTTYANDAAAFAAAMEAELATVTLLKECTFTSKLQTWSQYNLDLVKGNITIDLNGYTLTGVSTGWDAAIGVKGANVTIVDKSIGLEGLISHPGNAPIRYESGKLTIVNGNFKGKQYGIKVESVNLGAPGKLTLLGGTFTGGTSAVYLHNPNNYKYVGMDGLCFMDVQNDTKVSVPTDWTALSSKSVSVKLENPFTLKFNTEGYATYSAELDMIVTSPDVKAYKATVVGEDIVINELDGYIPAGNGALLYGGKSKAGQTIEFAPAYGVSAADMSGNDLLPTTQADGSLVEKPANDVVYALGPQNEFLEYTASAFIHNRAYLTLPAAVDSKAMKFVFAEETAIKSVAADKSANVSKFIENGKLVIMKNGVKYNVMGVHSF